MQKNNWLEKFIKIITCIISPIFSLLGFNIFNIPILYLKIITFICIVYALICLTKIYGLNKSVIHKSTKKFYKKFKKNVDNVIFILLIVILLWTPRCEPIKTLTIEIMNNIISSSDESEDNNNQSPLDELEDEHKKPLLNELEKNNKIYSSIKPEEQNDRSSSDKLERNNQPLSDEPEDNNNQPEKSWTEFSLEHPNGYPKINDEEYIMLKKRLFYECEDKLRERIESEITIWLNSCQTNNSLDTAVTSSGKSTEYYSSIEASFTNENGRILSSNLLDEVISGRKELYESHPNGGLAWFLANHMQTYALNYLYLTKNNKKSVLYFYLESIKYTQESLEFDIDIESKYKRIKYLQSRYKDIAECGIIDNGIRLKAYEIYTSFQEVLNELHIS